MESLNLGVILNFVIGGIFLSVLMGIVGMVFWYVKVKPDFDYIKSDLAKKAAASEVQRIALDLERKKQDEERVKEEIESKRSEESCNLLRAGCHPILQLSIDHLSKEIEGLSAKIDYWMSRRREEINKS